MPRHRIEHQPRHRAQRPTRPVVRRVQLIAVPARLQPAAHARPATGAGRVGAAFDAFGTTASDRLLAAGARLRRDQGPLLTGAVRGLLVSPWFAAGAGFVIAAGAFLYAPHAELEFGNAVGVTQCRLAECNQTTEQGAQGLTAGSGAAPLTDGTTPAASAGLTFRYTVDWQGHGAFQMVLTVTAKHAIGDWRLALVIPGASRVSVVGATWTPSGTDGGTATGTTTGTGASPHGIMARPDWPGHASDQPDSVSLIVRGFGAPAAPSNCAFNGAPCQFSRS